MVKWTKRLHKDSKGLIGSVETYSIVVRFMLIVNLYSKVDVFIAVFVNVDVYSIIQVDVCSTVFNFKDQEMKKDENGSFS